MLKDLSEICLVASKIVAISYRRSLSYQLSFSWPVDLGYLLHSHDLNA